MPGTGASPTDNPFAVNDLHRHGPGLPALTLPFVLVAWLFLHAAPAFTRVQVQ